MNIGTSVSTYTLKVNDIIYSHDVSILTLIDTIDDMDVSMSFVYSSMGTVNDSSARTDTIFGRLKKQELENGNRILDINRINSSVSDIESLIGNVADSSDVSSIFGKMSDMYDVFDTRLEQLESIETVQVIDGQIFANDNSFSVDIDGNITTDLFDSSQVNSSIYDLSEITVKLDSSMRELYYTLLIEIEKVASEAMNDINHRLEELQRQVNSLV